MWFILLLLSIAFAQEECRPYQEYYKDSERGWFWKEVCQKKEVKKEKEKKEEKKEEKELPSVVSIPWDKIDRLDPSEIAKLEEKSRKIAIMYPTEHNIREYRKLIYWIQTKAKTFTFAYYKDMKTNPLGDVQKYSFTPVRIAMYEWRKEKYNDVFERYRDRAGIVVLEDRDCPYCQAFKTVLSTFRRERGWDVKEIYVDERPDLAQRLGTQMVPDVFLVLKTSEGFRWQRIGAGAMSLDELEDSIIFGLYNLGEIKDERIVNW